MCLLIENVSIENEKSQFFGIFKFIHGINLCSHMAHKLIRRPSPSDRVWELANKGAKW